MDPKKSLNNIPLDLSKLTDIDLFKGCTSLKSIPNLDSIFHDTKYPKGTKAGKFFNDDPDQFIIGILKGIVIDENTYETLFVIDDEESTKYKNFTKIYSYV